MDHKVRNLVLFLCAICVLALGCGGGSGSDFSPNGGSPGNVYPAGTGGVSMANGGTTPQPSATGGNSGSGGTAGVSSSSDPTDSYMARQIAVAAKTAVTFLWNRDMNSLSKTSFSVSDICLLTGGYRATGTRGMLSSSCSGTASA